MSVSLTELSSKAFSEALASKASVPGGGGAAALIGSLAAALGTMATNLTIGKKKYLSWEEDHKRIIAETDELRQRFLSLIEEDAEAFEPLVRAYSMDKNAPDYVEVMTTATLRAAETPLRMMQASGELIVLLEELREKCSLPLLSDVGCAAVAAKAALECASMNVFVNTRLLPGNESAEEMTERAAAMLREYAPRAEAVADSVMSFLRDVT